MPLDNAWVSDRLPGRRFVWLESTPSTMEEASRLARAGCASGATVCAEEQTAGQGRLGRSWHSERGAGLYVSVVLRLPLPPERMPVLTLALGLAAAEAIAAESGAVCDLRWPNDVLVDGKKCAGILTQFQDGAAIAGIGINVNHAAFPAEIAPIATSLRLATGREQSREALLARLLEAVDAYAALLARAGAEPVLRLFEQASSYARGRRVVVEQDPPLEGVTDGLDESGFLWLRLDGGARKLIVAGGVRPAA